tara:strand:- start:1021 stop:1551 length:531 start_codon:yes stop_codon:yes gene_type:complete
MSQLKVNSIVPLSGLPAGATGGGVIQTVQTVKTDTASTNSQTFNDVITCSITPSSNSSKILLMYKIAVSSNNGGYSGSVRLVRDSQAIYVGDSAGNRTQASSFSNANSSGNGSYCPRDLNGMFVDSPATDSAVTYRIQWRSDYSGQTIYAGRDHANLDSSNYARTPTSLVCMEITS